MVWQVRRASALVAACLAFALVAGCYEIRSSNGGGQASFDRARAVQVSDVAVPDGYRIEVVATGLTFPSAIAVDADGVPHVVEADYSYGEVWTVPRLLRIGSDGSAGAMAPALNDKPLPKALMRLQIRIYLGAMPAFAERELSDREVDDIVDHVVASEGTTDVALGAKPVIRFGCGPASCNPRRLA